MKQLEKYDEKTKKFIKLPNQYRLENGTIVILASGTYDPNDDASVKAKLVEVYNESLMKIDRKATDTARDVFNVKVENKTLKEGEKFRAVFASKQDKSRHISVDDV